LRADPSLLPNFRAPQRGKGPSTLDFETLRVEIAQLEPAVEAAAREALQLKAAVSRSEVAALDLKGELAAAEAEGARLAKQLGTRIAETARRDEDTGRAANERAAAERALEALRASIAATPPVLAMDYIAIKADVAALEKQCVSLERKIEVATLAAKNGGAGAATMRGGGALHATMPGAGAASAAARRKAADAAAPGKGLGGLLGVQTLRL
jgi:hypothetical protein